MAEHSFAKDLRYRCESAIAYALFWLFRALPVDTASAAGGLVARLFGPLSSAHTTAQQNMARALPDKTQTERRLILAGVWDNIGRVMAEYATLSRLRRPEQADRIQIDGIEHLERLKLEQTAAIFFSGHMGNWETIHLALARVLGPPAIVYRSPNNPYVHSLIRAARGDTTTEQIQKGSSGAREMIQVLKDSGRIALLIDQKMNTGLPIPFFGREAMTGDAVARLALRVDCPVVPTRVERLDGCKFKVSFEEPWQVTSTDNPDEDVHGLLVCMNEKLESWIRERPGEWLWLHNRWPKDETG